MSLILVTGADGFIGRYLCSELIANGYQVCAARRKQSSRDDVTVLNSVVIGNITASTLWKDALRGVYCVVHLASRVHVMSDIGVDSLAEFRVINVEGTVNLAKQAAALGVKRFIYLSTIKVNGEMSGLGNPFKADDVPAPIGAYAVSKYEAEQALLTIAKTTGLEVVIIRPPLVYGPGVKANFLRMMQWLEKGVPLPLGAIHNKRSFVSLTNLVRLIITCIEHHAATNRRFLVGDGEDLSTTELLTRTGKALGIKTRIFPFPESILKIMAKLTGQQALILRLCGTLQVDITKTKKVLGWEPVTKVDEALKKTATAYLAEKNSNETSF